MTPAEGSELLVMLSISETVSHVKATRGKLGVRTGDPPEGIREIVVVGIEPGDNIA
jgi:hypothetical protein